MRLARGRTESTPNLCYKSRVGILVYGKAYGVPLNVIDPSALTRYPSSPKPDLREQPWLGTALS